MYLKAIYLHMEVRILQLLISVCRAEYAHCISHGVLTVAGESREPLSELFR